MYEIFARLLAERGLKPADITRETGINSTVFSEWKKGKSKPNTEKLIKIAKFLNVSVEYLSGNSKIIRCPKYLPVGCLVKYIICQSKLFVKRKNRPCANRSGHISEDMLLFALAVIFIPKRRMILWQKGKNTQISLMVLAVSANYLETVMSLTQYTHL